MSLFPAMVLFFSGMIGYGLLSYLLRPKKVDMNIVKLTCFNIVLSIWNQHAFYKDINKEEADIMAEASIMILLGSYNSEIRKRLPFTNYLTAKSWVEKIGVK